VAIDKDAFNCRGCHIKGRGAISLVMALDGADFLDVVETLVGPLPDGKKNESDEERRAREQRSIKQREKYERERQERKEREAEELRRQRRKAAWLWSQRRPITGSIAEKYLRRVRGISGPLPPTLAFLPSRKPEHHPALVACFALVDELEPGVLAEPHDARAVHLTLLRPDGSGKAEVPEQESSKIAVGSHEGIPILIAPPNDLLSLAVTEGIEDGLSVHEVTGCGVWVAGSACHMPKLAASIPGYIECVVIYAHDDPGGRDGAHALAELLYQRGIEVLVEGSP
jgi:hypothetical protein